MHQRFRQFLYWIICLLCGRVTATRFLGVQVGRDCRIGTHAFGTEPWLVRLGDRVTVTAGTVFLTHDGATCLVCDAKGRRYRYARIEVGSDVFIGVNSILLPGVRIGDRVVIAAGSVVTKSVPDNVIVAGNPARVIMTFDGFHARTLVSRPCGGDMVGHSYRERVESVCEAGFRPTLAAGNEVSPTAPSAPHP